MSTFRKSPHTYASSITLMTSYICHFSWQVPLPVLSVEEVNHTVMTGAAVNSAGVPVQVHLL